MTAAYIYTLRTVLCILSSQCYHISALHFALEHWTGTSETQQTAAETTLRGKGCSGELFEVTNMHNTITDIILHFIHDKTSFSSHIGVFGLTV